MTTTCLHPLITLRRPFALVCLVLLSLLTNPVRADNGILLHNGQKLAFFGDSITAHGWENPGGYVKLIMDAFAKEGITLTPIPAGGSGAKSDDLVERLDRLVLSKQPDWMTLSCGVNDVWSGARGVPLDAYKKNMTEILDRAKAKGVKVLLLTATVITEDENNPNNQKLAPYNDWLRQTARERNLPLADVGAAIRTALSKTKTSNSSRNLTIDGVHMNAEGDLIMAKTCLRAFGFSEKQLEKIEQQWLTQPDNATFNSGQNVSAKVGITLAQYRGMEAWAKSRDANLVDAQTTLWLRAVSEVIQAHAKDPILDAAKIQSEASDLIKSQFDRMPPP
ncbi:MAG TPA: GDSL-type esterase/lipase family protein [Rariglobus sp.]|nr:GDSL-type esterase/lipase family protein [Rariglobus sp.]